MLRGLVLGLGVNIVVDLPVVHFGQLQKPGTTQLLESDGAERRRCGTEAANATAAHFEQVHQAREFPVDMPTFALSQATNIIDLLVATGLCGSKGEARRVVQQGGVRIDGEPVSSVDATIEPGEAVLQRGKRHFVRLVGG